MEMSLIETIKVVSELGFMVCCAAVVLYFFIAHMRKISQEKDVDKQLLNKIQEEDKNRYNQMVDTIVSQVTTHTLNPEEDRWLSIIEKNINALLNVALEKTNASRVYIVRYHNGGRGSNGVSFLKMSMTNEVVAIDAPSAMADFQNQFRSLLAYWCNQLDTADTCYINDREEIKSVDSTMYQFMSSRGVKSKYGNTIRDRYNNPIGFMCIEYLDGHVTCDNEALPKQALERLRPKIEALLNINM